MCECYIGETSTKTELLFFLRILRVTATELLQSFKRKLKSCKNSAAVCARIVTLGMSAR